MRASPPRFWSAPGHPAARALSPIGAAYGRIVARRLARAVPHNAGVPVICAGNATMGGVGKTPWTAMLADRLTARGRTPHILLRGYGGTARGPLPARGQDVRTVGDEALLLAEHAPTWVGADRAASAMAAEAAGADVLLLDDGFQNPGLAKNLSFLLIDAEALFGNGRVFPAGPLREPPEAAALRAQALVSVGSPGHHVPDEVSKLARGKPVLRAWLDLDLAGLEPGRPVHAFAGIGRPERFFERLRAEGLRLDRATAFPDHHPFAPGEIEDLIAAARAAGAALATTGKDYVRLPETARRGVIAIPATMKTEDAALARLLDATLEIR